MPKNNNVNIKLFIASTLSIFTIFLSWKSFYNLGCFSLLFPLIILIVVSHSYIDKKMNEKLCFSKCYFQDKSRFAKILSSPYIVSIFYFILSMVLTLSIMYGIVGYVTSMWGYLVIHIILVVFIYVKIINLLKNTIQDKFLEIFAREWTIAMSSILLLLVYIFIFINGYEPEYLSESIESTIKKASNSISSSCIYIDYILRINIELDSAFWWLVKNSSDAVKNESIKSIIWISFILINSLTILGVNRFIVQIVYLLARIFKKENDEK